MTESIVSCKVKIFRTSRELAEAFALDLVNEIREAEKKGLTFTAALSGGRTPHSVFSLLAEKYGDSVNWSNVHLFWGDERCVPPEDFYSNYRMTYKILLSRIKIPESNVHRIRGEEDPEKEALRYSGEIVSNTRSLNGLPAFDHIMLGMGNDGHTASIFPENSELLNSDKICAVAVHPGTGQKRITLTGKVINNAENLTFLITGLSKARIIEQIFNKKANFPASLIIPVHGKIKWMIDEKAGRLLRI